MKRIPLFICLWVSIAFLNYWGGSGCTSTNTGASIRKTCEQTKEIDEFLTLFSDTNTRIRVPLKRKGILKTITFENYKKSLFKMAKGNERNMIDHVKKADQGCIKASRSNFVVCLFSKKHEFKICDNAFTPSLTDTACHAEEMSKDDFTSFCSKNFKKFEKYLQR